MNNQSAGASSIRPPVKMGRPVTGAGRAVMVRLHQPFNSLIDEWRAHHLERPSRPDAIRRLLTLGLGCVAEQGGLV